MAYESNRIHLFFTRYYLAWQCFHDLPWDLDLKFRVFLFSFLKSCWTLKIQQDFYLLQTRSPTFQDLRSSVGACTFLSVVKHHFMNGWSSFIWTLLLISGVFTHHTLTSSSRLNPTLCNFVHLRSENFIWYTGANNYFKCYIFVWMFFIMT